METQSNKLDFSDQNIYVGFDVHLKSWKVTIMTEKVTYKTFSQDPKPEVLYQYLKRNFPGGNYHSAYEAGFCGYWIHNKLKSLGINSVLLIRLIYQQLIRKKYKKKINEIVEKLPDLYAMVT